MTVHNQVEIDQTIERMLKDADVRRSITHESFLWFFIFYFARYLTVEMADFQKEIIQVVENTAIRRATIVAFRGSGKSTIVSLAYVLWAVMGREQRKCVVIAAESQEQAKRLIMDIKANLEAHELLARDLGPFRENSMGEWRNTSLQVANFDALIVGVHVGQSMRGIKHRERRPDLIICDDIEDAEAVRTLDARNKTANWVRGELFSAKAKNTRFMIVGNYLHDDSFTQRLRRGIPKECKDEVYLHFPLLDDDGKCLWPQMYPNKESIDILRRDIDDDALWYREYLLAIIADSERVIHKDWIEFYDELPTSHSSIQLVAMGVDLAYSDNDRSDCTSIVCVLVIGYDEEKKFYILPNIINAKLLPADVENTARSVADSLKCYEDYPYIFIENVMGQQFFISRLEEEGYLSEGIPIHGMDKRTRLAVHAHLIQSKKVLFPRTGAEELINQIVNFGAERYDDLADAYSVLMIGAVKRSTDSPPVNIIRGEPSRLRDRMRQWGY